MTLTTPTRWLRIDIAHRAITLIKKRLRDWFGEATDRSYATVGEPVSLPDPGTPGLAAQDPYQFQWWALGLVGARPVEQKTGADRGIDGRIYFHDEAELVWHVPESAKGVVSGSATSVEDSGTCHTNRAATKQIVLSVKAGKIGPDHVRDLRGVVDREGAAIGVLIAMHEPTQPMRSEAASASTKLWSAVA